MTKDNNNDRSPGQWTAYILYVAMVTIMYFAITPKVVGPISEHEERDFHVAVVRLDRNADEPPFAGYTIRFLKSGEVDPASISFLLPEGNIDIPGGDAHTVTVLERHADWQLIEYRYGNSHDSTSLYRAFKDRIEPVSYHITMHPGVFLWAVILVFPAHLLGKRINAAWNAAARRKDSRPE